MKLYHGTNEEFIPAILKHGLRPRSTKPGNWEKFPSRPDMVYLTSTYPFYFAANTEGKGRFAVLEIDIDVLKESKLYPDEDFILHCLWKKRVVLEDPAYIALHQKIRNGLNQYKNDWKLSLDKLGNCCYKGTIKSFSRICYLDYKVPRGLVLSFCLDPSISLLNYAFTGQEYQQFVSWMFGDNPKLPDKMDAFPDADDPLTLERRKAFAQESADRTGIEIQVL